MATPLYTVIPDWPTEKFPAPQHAFSSRDDLSGRTFSRWIVISRAERSPNGKSQWNCICTCKTERVVLEYDLVAGKSRSCGCLRAELSGARNFHDLTGMVFGRLKVLKRAPNGRRGSVRWECMCACNSVVTVKAEYLVNRHTRSCGCFKLEQSRLHQVKDLVGQRFGRLVVVERDEWRPARPHVYWHCICDCKTKTSVKGIELTSGRQVSCGCLRSERGHEAFPIVHGKSETPEYTAWLGMIARCLNPNNPTYPSYGGRGIYIADEWRKSFTVFLEDMGLRPSKKHSVHRINNDGPYSKDNCCWALPEEQQNGTRRSRPITFDGQTLTLAQWARQLGIDPGALWQRIERFGWPLDRALTTPPRRMKTNRPPTDSMP